MTRSRSHIHGALVAVAALVLQACGADRALTAPLGTAVAPAASEGFPDEELAPGADGGAILLVDDADRGDCPGARFTSIQAAVDAAESGDRIFVCHGTYEENVKVATSNLRIEARGGPRHVVLQGPGTAPFGFLLENTTGVLVQGFTVQGYGDANIIVRDGSANIIRENVVTNGAVDGIEVLRSSGNLIERNVVFANTAFNADGIFVSQAASFDNIILDNEVHGNGQHGINLFQTGSGNVVSGNRSHDNRGRGIQSVQGSNGNVIENNDAFSNGLVPGGPVIVGGGAGILVLASNGVTIRNNRTDGNGASGITVNGANNNVVSNNRSDRNAVAGIVLNGSSDNLVEENTVHRNGLDGVRLTNAAHRNTVRLNEVLSNDGDGIRVLGPLPAENTFDRNLSLHSAGHDARDDSLGSGTSGTANFWLGNHCKSGSPPELCADL